MATFRRCDRTRRKVVHSAMTARAGAACNIAIPWVSRVARHYSSARLRTRSAAPKMRDSAADHRLQLYHAGSLEFSSMNGTTPLEAQK